MSTEALTRKDLFLSHQLRRNTGDLPEPENLEDSQNNTDEENDESNLPDVKGIKSKSFDHRTRTPSDNFHKKMFASRRKRDSEGERGGTVRGRNSGGVGSGERPDRGENGAEGQPITRDRSTSMIQSNDVFGTLKGLKKRLFRKKLDVPLHSDEATSPTATSSSKEKSVKRSGEIATAINVSTVDDLPKDVRGLMKQIGIEANVLNDNHKLFRLFISICEFDKKRGLVFAPQRQMAQSAPFSASDNTTSSEFQKNLKDSTVSAPEITITEVDIPATLPTGADTPPNREDEFLSSRERYHYPDYVSHYSTFRSIAEASIVEENPRQKYRFIQQVGKGGFGRVYDIRTKDHQQLAMKRVSHKEKKERDRNLDELGAMIFCSKHPNVVTCYSPTYVFDNDIWIKMEFLRGGTLAEAIKRHPWSEKQISYVCCELLSALNFLHSHFILYRDLKPDNVMLSTEGDIKLIDLGLLCDVKDGNDGRLAGSSLWLAPEIIRKDPYSFPVDIWALGCTLIEIVSPKSYPKAPSVQVMWETATTGKCAWVIHKSVQPKLASSFLEFVNLCLEPEPSQRPSCSTLLSHRFCSIKEEKSVMEKLFSLIFLQNSLDIRL